MKYRAAGILLAATLLVVPHAVFANPHYWQLELGAAFPADHASGDEPARMTGFGAGWWLWPRGELSHDIFARASVGDGTTRAAGAAYDISIRQLGWRATYRYPGTFRWFVLSGGLLWSDVNSRQPNFGAAGNALQLELGVGFGFGERVDMMIRVNESFDDSFGETAGAYLSFSFD